VAAIATVFGGGGHTRAAGFSAPLDAHSPTPFDVLNPAAGERHEASG